MTEIKIMIVNKLGLHARAAAKFVSTASAFGCEIKVGKNDTMVDGKSIMSVMMLAASKGTELTLSCNGHDEQAATQAISTLVNNRFDEGE
ncbi:MAG: HPr family phosphocarrier protein [Spongiibacteraceae bacterium]|nr:HPr family phosphocarrier protein [Spongiibacteraceae bacterium]